MRHLVGFFMIARVLGGCSLSTVGSMDPEDGGKCDTPMETKQGADGCSECTCDGSTWSCEDDACTPACTDGATKAADDGCNTCTCGIDGTWNCTVDDCGETECTPGETSHDDCVSCECKDDGTWSCTESFDGICGEPMCTPGTTMPAGDGCNTCTCLPDGTLACTLKACGEPPVCDPGKVNCDGDPGNGCEVDLNTSPDNCGSCGLVCVGEMSVCTAGVCSSPGDDTCLYQGVHYSAGAIFPSRDGCNVCECDDTGTGANANCTELGCGCDPADEASYRDYLGGPDSCVPGGYVCPEHTTSFENACGCGCEQSVECPNEYRCPPDGTMSETCAELQVRCPYTVLLRDL